MESCYHMSLLTQELLFLRFIVSLNFNNFDIFSYTLISCLQHFSICDWIMCPSKMRKKIILSHFLPLLVRTNCFVTNHNLSIKLKFMHKFSKKFNFTGAITIPNHYKTSSVIVHGYLIQFDKTANSDFFSSNFWFEKNT